MRAQKTKRNSVIFAALVLMAACTLLLALVGERSNLKTPSGSPVGSPRLVSVQEVPDYGEVCAREPPSRNATMIAALQEKNLFASFQETAVHAASPETGDTAEVTRPPVRTIKDTYPIYSSIAVDQLRDEVVLQDTNLFSIKVFNRLDNTTPNAEPAQPKRVIQGPHTLNEYNNGLYIDPQTGNIHSVAMDTADSMIVFPGGANVDVSPIRKLNTPHRNFATAVNEEKGEIYITIQYPPKVMVYRKEANGDEKPLRVLEGEHTRLYDTHGIALDVKQNLMFVGTWGNASDYRVAGTGKFYPPSINVYRLDASGDTAPLHVIQGSKTRLDWAGGMSLDPDRGDLYVANDVGNSILVFRETDDGDVAPARIINGDKTGLNHPAGISLDLKNQEFWVSNMGNSSATCYSLKADGNARPVRTMRSAPLGRKPAKSGKPQAVASDSKEKMAYYEWHGECIMRFAAPKVLIFPRESNGGAAPIRVLGGPDTQIRGSRRGHPLVGVDPVNNLLIVGSTGGEGGGRDSDGESARGRGSLLIFDRTASGNTKPKAVIQGPNTAFGGVGQIQTYPPKGWIIAGALGGGIGAWSIHDSGDAPPRWKIPVRQITGVAPSGVALDPVHKELIIASGARNVLLTFSWPEIFE